MKMCLTSNISTEYLQWFDSISLVSRMIFVLILFSILWLFVEQLQMFVPRAGLVCTSDGGKLTRKLQYSSTLCTGHLPLLSPSGYSWNSTADYHLCGWKMLRLFICWRLQVFLSHATPASFFCQNNSSSNQLRIVCLIFNFR